MCAKLLFAAASLVCVALASGVFLGTVPTKVTAVDLDSWGGIMHSLMAADTAHYKDKELEDIEDAVENLVAKPRDASARIFAKSLGGLISKTMIPNRERSQKNDQMKMDTQFKQLESCDLDKPLPHKLAIHMKNSKRDMSMHREFKVAEGHKDDYKEHITQHQLCQETLKNMELLKDAHCVSAEKKVCACDKKLADLMWKGEKKDNRECQGAPKVADADRKCCDAVYEHEKHNLKCAHVADDVDNSKMQHKISMSKVCDMYNNCYDERLDGFKKVKEIVKQSEVRRNWAVLFRIQCLVEEVRDGKVTKEGAKACKEKKYEVKGIQYPAALPTKECSINLED